MGDEEHRLAFGGAPYGFVEDLGAHTSIDSTERVVQEEDGPLAVECTSQAHSLTLSPTQVSTSLPNLDTERRQRAS